MGKGTHNAHWNPMQQGEIERGLALANAKRDIAQRIRRVCLDFGEEEFERLVERMARIDVRYRLRDDWGMRVDSRFGEQN
jgi:hypothetical protein